MGRRLDGTKTRGGRAESKDRNVAQSVLPEYDATPLVGLRVVVISSAIESVDEAGEKWVEVPRIKELMAAAAVQRCLTPIKLRGWEIKAIRKVMGLTLAELAKALDERTAPETVSRWESEAQPIGGYAEKVLRLLVCERLQESAPGVSYNGGMISELRVLDPWITDKGFEVPPLRFCAVRMKEQSGSVIDAWGSKLAA